MHEPQPDIDVLVRAECLRLLRSVPFGRLVYTVAGLPAVQPVNFTIHGDAVIIRTASESKLAAATRDAVVAFEADDIDPQSRSGWSVTVVGRCHPVVDPIESAELARTGPQAWGQPDSVRFIAVGVEQITGRRMHSSGVTVR